MHHLANRLRPTSGSRYVTWQMAVLERINNFLCLYIKPRLVHAMEGGPLLEHATNQNLPKEVTESLHMAFLFETMQVERKVPLAKYDMRDEEEPAPNHGTTPSSRLEQKDKVDMAQEFAEFRQQQSLLKEENSNLKAKIERLEVKLAIATSVLEDHTGKKVVWTEVSSSVDDQEQLMHREYKKQRNMCLRQYYREEETEVPEQHLSHGDSDFAEE